MFGKFQLPDWAIPFIRTGWGAGCLTIIKLLTVKIVLDK